MPLPQVLLLNFTVSKIKINKMRFFLNKRRTLRVPQPLRARVGGGAATSCQVRQVLPPVPARVPSSPAAVALLKSCSPCTGWLLGDKWTCDSQHPKTGATTPGRPCYLHVFLDPCSETFALLAIKEGTHLLWSPRISGKMWENQGPSPDFLSASGT
jgi:hypothetical protein